MHILIVKFSSYIFNVGALSIIRFVPVEPVLCFIANEVPNQQEVELVKVDVYLLMGNMIGNWIFTIWMTQIIFFHLFLK